MIWSTKANLEKRQFLVNRIHIDLFIIEELDSELDSTHQDQRGPAVCRVNLTCAGTINELLLQSLAATRLFPPTNSNLWPRFAKYGLQTHGHRCLTLRREDSATKKKTCSQRLRRRDRLRKLYEPRARLPVRPGGLFRRRLDGTLSVSN